MANNRIYLRCKGCGETLFLGKCFGDGYFWHDYYEGKKGSLADQLNRFYDEHTWCEKEKVKPPYPFDEELFPIPDGFSACVGAFDIVYECDWGTGLDVQAESIIGEAKAQEIEL